jgi:tetratricopeptide (TPR) repeat protein
MKTLLLGSGFSLMLMASPVGAQQDKVEIGGSVAHSCFEAAMAGRHDDGAFALCNNALEEPLLIPDRAGTLVNRGIMFMRAGREDLATRDYDEAINLDPQQAEAFLNKAVSMVNSGRGSTALDLADRALQLRTHKPALAYYVRGLAHEEQGNVQAAYADLRNAASLDPKWSEPAEQLKRYRVVR